MVSLLGGCHAAESIVGTVFVVVDVELPGGIADIFESGEQVLVKNLLAAGAVERLDVSVLVRFARLDVLDRHAVRFGPLHEGLTEEFGAVIRAQHLREWPLLSDTLEDAHQAYRCDRGVDLDMDDLAIEVIGHVEGSERTATGQRIEHEVGRPHAVGVLGYVQRHALALGHSPGCGPPQIEVHGAVHPVDAFVVPVWMALLQDLAAFVDAATGFCFYQPGQGSDDLGITHRPVQRGRSATGRHSCRSDARAAHAPRRGSARPRASAPALQLFCNRVLHRRVVQRKFGVHPFELGILGFQLLDALQVRGIHAAYFDFHW